MPAQRRRRGRSLSKGVILQNCLRRCNAAKTPSWVTAARCTTHHYHPSCHVFVFCPLFFTSPCVSSVSVRVKSPLAGGVSEVLIGAPRCQNGEHALTFCTRWGGNKRGKTASFTSHLDDFRLIFMDASETKWELCLLSISLSLRHLTAHRLVVQGQECSGIALHNEGDCCFIQRPEIQKHR